MSRNTNDWPAITSLLTGRIIYAINWVNISSIFSFIAQDLGGNVADLGLLTSAFFLGITIFQIPSGLMAAKIGPRKTVVAGTALASLASLLTGLSGNFLQMILLRFIVGVGMAMVYAPAVTLVAKYSKTGSEGMGIGLYNAAYSAGGVVAGFGWITIADALGWRGSLFLSGTAGLLTAALVIVFTPADEAKEGFRVRREDLLQALLNRTLLLYILGTGVVYVGLNLVSAFMIFYLEKALRIAPALAGLIGTMYLAVSVLSSPLAGRIYDRVRNPALLLFVGGTLMSSGILLVAVNNTYSAIAGLFMVGLATGVGTTVGYAAARETNTAGYETLAVSWTNALVLSSGFFAPPAFSFVVIQSSYAAAWTAIGTATLLLSALVYLLNRKRRTAPTRLAEPGPSATSGA
ncbi:MAG: MFS transporter [Nitrososphaerota archaeon]|nr:MFS transporter [Nitrososphaerota archaeon]